MEPLTEKFSNNMSERGARRFKEELGYSGNRSEEEREEAKSRIINTLLTLEKNGDIVV